MTFRSSQCGDAYHRTLRNVLRALGALFLVGSATTLEAQSPPATAARDTGRTVDAGSQAPSAQPPGLPFAFSGVLYTNYQYGGVKGNRAQNRFDLDRAYLNFRARGGERDSIRVTLDVFQQRDTTRDAYYRGWAFRAKYAFLQHDVLRGPATAVRMSAKLGLIQTVVLDKEEQFWPRGLAQVALEQAGYFSSSDAGVASTVSLPNGFGEVYATIVNGNAYTSRELDRFKDFAARFTLAPFARSSGFAKSLQISPWFSKGERASDFAVRHGTVLAVADGRQRDRHGVLITARDPRLTLGLHLASRTDVIEQADTTHDTAPTTTTRTGRLWSVYAIVRPFAYGKNPSSPFWIVLRADQLKPNADADGYQRFWVAGASWDFNPRTSVTLDLQSGYPQNGLVVADSKVVFFHIIANF